MTPARAHACGGTNLNDTAGIAQYVVTQAQGSGVTVSAGNVTLCRTGASGTPMRVTVR